MHRPKLKSHILVSAFVSIAVVVVVMAACTGGQTDVTVFEGARVIVGDGSAPIEDAVFIVEGDRLTAVGARNSVDIPRGATRVDLAGKTVMPAIVNAHVHLAVEREERTAQLQHMAYYGAGTVQSLGHDSGEVAFQMKDELVPDGARGLTAGRGITMPEPGRSEASFWVSSEEEARAAVQELAGQDVGLIKIWVDDRGGRYDKLSPELYGAVIDEAHKHDVRVTAHVFTLEDAKGLLQAGLDAFAHGIRDMDVDDELMSLWRDRLDVVLVPNLPNPGVPVDLSWLSTVPPDRLAEMQENASVERPDVQERFGIQARNLERLSSRAVKVAFGTDGSTPWAVHLEMEDMVRAGLSPAAVITAATGTSAKLLQMPDVGTLAVGKSADFIVLAANPLEDITNTRRIDAVYLRGTAIDREGLGAKFRGN